MEIYASSNAEPVSPLLDNILWLAGNYGLNVNRQSVTAGIPMPNGDLALTHLDAAAHRAGLSSRVVTMPAKRIKSSMLPCMAMMADQAPTIVLSINADEVVLLEPYSQGEQRVSIDDWRSQYLGQLILLRPRFEPDQRATTAGEQTRQPHWFRTPLKKVAPLYRDIFVASLLINLFALVSPLFIMNVYDRVLPNLAYDSLWVLAIGAGAAFIFDLLLKQIRAQLIDLAGKRVDLSVSQTLFSRVMGMRMEHRPASTGALARQFSEFDSVREFIASGTLTTLVDLPFSLFFLAVIAWVSGPLVWLPIAAIVVMIVTTAVLQPKMAQAIAESNKYSDLRHAHLYESITGIETIKSAGAEGPIQLSWEMMQAHSADWQVKSRKLTNLASHASSFAVQLSVLAVVVLGVYKVEEGVISMGGIIAAVILSSRAVAPMAQLINLMSRAHHVKATLTRFDDLMQLPQDHDADKFYPDPGPLTGQISAENLEFTYPGLEVSCLKGINFAVRPGQKLAVIGRNGSGKSTLAKLLLGLYRPAGGNLCFDGRNVEQLHSGFLRSQIGYVPQDLRLFYGSIHDNILLGASDVTDQQLMQAVERSGVGLFTALDAEGLNRQVGESGQALSVGERQAVALARALLFDPPILLLDEPTSNLDARAEMQFIKTVKELSKDKTLILITHKHSLLELVDSVMVLERGRIAAMGPRDDVLNRLKGSFKASQREGESE